MVSVERKKKRKASKCKPLRFLSIDHRKSDRIHLFIPSDSSTGGNISPASKQLKCLARFSPSWVHSVTHFLEGREKSTQPLCFTLPQRTNYPAVEADPISVTMLKVIERPPIWQIYVKPTVSNRFVHCCRPENMKRRSSGNA